METNVMDGQLLNDGDSAIDPKKADSLVDMSDQEMSQHLSLCLKLAAENKITTKNAFGLHLIGIMRRWIKKDTPDLLFASLSLQASSKIYAGRVEALYKDTFAFHNHLQTIVSNEKVSKDRDQVDDQYDDGSEDRREKRRTKTKQVYLTTEENVAFKSEVNCTSTAPHANFITIKTAFSTSRAAPKLLEGLIVENDLNQLCCAKASSCFNPLMHINISDFLFPEKKRVLMRKALNFKMNYAGFDSNITSSDVFLQSRKDASPIAVPELDLSGDDSFCIGTTPVKDDQDVDEIIERFSVLDITADLFANDLSLAIGNDNTVDRRLLPPNSALKRVLNTAEKSRVSKTPSNKKRQEIKSVKEPFFNKQRVVDKSILTKGRKIEMTDNGVSDWKLSDTTESHTGGHEMFFTVLAEHYDKCKTTNYSEEDAIRITYKLIQEKDDLSYLDGYLRKPIQKWNRFRQQPYTCLIRPSSFGVCLRNESDLENASNSLEAKSNCIIQSFQNLSIHASHGESDDDEDLCMPPDDNGEDLFFPETPAITRSSRISGAYEDDLKSVMVTPPELVQPINMKFQTEPITLNTEKVRNAIWDIIEKDEQVMLTDVHEKLKNIFVREKLPLQFAFAMLLLLANQKCLLLENVSNGADVKIMKDVNELTEMC